MSMGRHPKRACVWSAHVLCKIHCARNEQTMVPVSILGESAPFLQDNMKVECDLVEGEIVAVHLPQTVILEVVEADPVVKGQTASSSYKPAKLSNGVKTDVPPFIEAGERIVVRTEDSTYVERAKK